MKNDVVGKKGLDKYYRWINKITAEELTQMGTHRTQV